MEPAALKILLLLLLFFLKKSVPLVTIETAPKSTLTCVLYIVILDSQEMETRLDGLVFISRGKKFFLKRGKSRPTQPETRLGPEENPALGGNHYGVRRGLNQELPMEVYEGSESLQTY